MSALVGIDIGGTFTDLLLFEEDGSVHREKVSTTQDDFSAGFVTAIEKACKSADVSPDDLTYLSHGTTVATNAIIEQDGVETALITTDGFRDVTAIGREDRENVYDISPAKTPTFTDRRNRYGVTGRLSADGEVVEPLDADEIADLADELSASAIDSVAISLLHAYRDDRHERRVAELLRERTDLSLSLSSAVMPEIQEYERTLSTVLNAYIGPLVNDYVDALHDRLDAMDVPSELHLMLASGGVITPEHVQQRTLRLINSGPAAGVIGAKNFATEVDVESIITLDMGGTSADACVVRDGEIEMTTEGELNEIPLLFPQIDVRAVGAGGGSIAWLDPADVLKVGPKSAGADPGPACYGRGGDQPTVTDAALVLGYLNPEYFLGGEMEIDASAAEDALRSLAGRLDQDVVELANGVLEIAVTNMTQAIRLVTVEKGHDPRDFALTCYGGAGPLFTTRLAEALDIETTLIPPAPGVLSASGLLSADRQYDFSTSHIVRLDADAIDRIRSIYDALESDARAVADGDFDLERTVDLRYEGQTSKLTVPFPGGPIEEDALADLSTRFNRRYEDIYGHSNPGEPLEAVTWRLQATMETPSVDMGGVAADGDVTDAVKGTREAYADGEFVEHTVYDRYALPVGATVDGPAIVEETESTTIVSPASSFTVEPNGSLLVDVGSD